MNEDPICFVLDTLDRVYRLMQARRYTIQKLALGLRMPVSELTNILDPFNFKNIDVNLLSKIFVVLQEPVKLSCPTIEKRFAELEARLS